jgi:hypothetical protein
MPDNTNGLPFLTDSLFSISEAVLSTNNEYERDRWGALLEMEINGLRVNDYVIIFSYIEPNDEGYSLCDLEGICHLEDLFVRAKYFHNCYYEGMPVVYHIDIPKQLKNRPSKVCKLLDQYYTPPKDFISTPPSDILPIITKKSAYESGREWAWFDQTLFLTQSTRKRTGLMKSREVFDESVSGIFQTMKINVRNVALKHYDSNESLIQNIESNIRSAKIQDIEFAIESKKRDLEKLKADVIATEESIMDLYSELNVVKTLG